MTKHQLDPDALRVETFRTDPRGASLALLATMACSRPSGCTGCVNCGGPSYTDCAACYPPPV